ncbi:MAG: hypothetical protein K2X82_30280 [Gemmataceae bacterium]|nr:hypothetical protein [Gemmataceae bacterium]
MRYVHGLKTLPRFLLLAPLFGVAAALLVLAGSPQPAAADPVFIPNTKCTQTACDNFLPTGTQGRKVWCKLNKGIPVNTCGSSGNGCYNDAAYSITGCGGECQDGSKDACTFYIAGCPYTPP